MALVLLPSKTETFRTAETLFYAAVGGIGLTWAGMPAGLITGSLLAVALAALAGRPVTVWAPLSRIILVLVGISLGAAVTPETLKGVTTFPLSIAVLAVATLCMIVATTAYLRWVHGWDPQSALFGASPGALAQVMALSAEYHADLRAIAIVQTMRVMLITVGIPSVLALLGLTISGGLLERLASEGPVSLVELAILVVASTAVALTIWWFRLPGGLIFGAMLGSGILHGGGFLTAKLPWWIAGAAVIGIGAVTGSRFANTDPRTLLRFLGAALGSFAVAIATVSVFVLALSAMLSLPVGDAVVAFAPGAQDTMMVLALSLHLDPVFVGAHHLARFMLVSLLVPFLAHRARSSPSAPKPKPPPRPTLED